MSDTSTLKAIGRISRSVAHDFNNALTSILSSAELLAEETGPDDPRSRDIARIRRACLRARALTVQLLAVTDSEVRARERIDLKRHIEERAPLLQNALGPDNRLQLEGLDGIELELDVQAFDALLLQLAMNAGAVMQSGALTLTVSRDRGEIVLCAEDTGRPLAEPEVAFLFDPSIDQGYTLAGAYLFAKRQDGAIQHEVLSAGNRVTVRLPRA